MVPARKANLKVDAMIRRTSLVACILSILFNIGCAPMEPAIKYYPKESSVTAAYFVNGEPVAVIEEDEFLLLLNLETVSIAGSTYTRVWLLFENKTSAPVLFEPLKFGTLTSIRISRSRSMKAVPQSPTTILAHVSNEETARVIALTVGGALEAMAQEPTRTSSGATIDDTWYKQKTVANETKAEVADVRSWYGAYRQSIDSGVLRKNTVFPGQSVNGCIYFEQKWVGRSQAPRGSDFSVEDVLNDQVSEKEYRVSNDFRHILEFELLGNVQEVEFAPIDGE